MKEHLTSSQMIISMSLMILGCCLIPGEPYWAGQVMLWLQQTLKPINEWLRFGNFFAETQGYILTFFLIFLLDKRRKEILPKIYLGVIFVSITSGLLKIIFSRHRPQFDRRNDYQPEVALSKMGHFFAGHHQGLKTLIDQDFLSFPSGHSLAAIFLACGLSYYYPRAKSIFFSLAILCIIYRFHNARHFMSDTFFGAGLGIMFWYIFQESQFIDRVMNKVKKVFSLKRGQKQITTQHGVSREKTI